MNISPKAKSVAIIITLSFLIANYSKAQAPNYSIVDNLNPVTPTMRQFTKYTDLPVSEYTGVPNIAIPLYEIDEDGVKIPIELTCHSGGIRVNEEASWVGLGWDMTIGSIVQQISDQDDYAANTHLQSDYINTSAPFLFPFKQMWASTPSGSGDAICNYGCNGPIETNPLTIADGIAIYTGHYAPFNGDYGYQTGQNYLNYFSNHQVGSGYSIDSEPDIFTATFLGHSFKFIRDPVTGQVVVLDKKGYQVTRIGQMFKVIVPNGEEYDFALKDVVQTSSQMISLTGTPSNTDPMPSSIIWMLTQIITRNKKVITFNYSQTPVQSCYPSATERGISATLQSYIYTDNTAEWQGFCQSSDVSSAGGMSTTPGRYSNISASTEQYTYLSSITFPNGTVNFNLSARNDIQGALKLDGFSVSSSQQVKSYVFNYSYFDATAVGGNTFDFGTSWGNYPLYRLKLLSIQDNSGATHTFTYNSTVLPAKNSFAVDYWGYYNGDINNISYVPNAAQFNKTGWWANGDNHSANISYTQAGILQQIKYPTGGTVNFTYGLNQFNNYWVPDYSSNTNTISSGAGLRVQSITWLDAANNQLKKTNYSYITGIASIPLNFFRSYTYSITPSGNLTAGADSYYLQKLYMVNETNMSGDFTANPFASFNGVGYSQVIKTDVDNNNNADGKIVSNYYNNPDLVYNTIEQAQQSDPTLPAYQDPLDTAENGSLKSELYYGNNNNLVKQVVNTYLKNTSPLYYGARLMGYASLVRYNYSGEDGVYQQNIIPQNMIGYYPVYDIESLLINTTQTDYFGTNAVTSTTGYNYDRYDQIISTSKTNSTYTETNSFTYPYSYPNNTVLAAMTAVNRIADIVTAIKSTPNSISYFGRGYQQNGGLFEAATDTTYTHLAYLPEFTTYDQYDPVNGNILQYTKNTAPNSFIWDYNKEYVIASIKNALYTNIAYTSFEADGTGNWTFTGTPTPDPAAPTGQKVYPLSGGNISCSGLDATLTYVVSYWSKNGAQTVSGSNATKTGYTINGYTYYEHNVPTPSGGAITVSGTGTIDELRLYPNTAQMTSYTYAPLVGVTTESNAGGKIAYYEYDNAMRLLDIRDQNKNILKAFCYNYDGQPTNCGVNITYPNAATSTAFSRNNCSGGYVGSSVSYNITQGKYVSTMSLQDANNQAQEDIAANGQANANTNGSCIVPPAITNIAYGGHGVGYTEVAFSSIPGCYTATISFVDLTTNQPGGGSVGCTSPQAVTVPILGHTYKFTVTCYSPDFSTGITSAPVNYTANN